MLRPAILLAVIAGPLGSAVAQDRPDAQATELTIGRSMMVFIPKSRDAVVAYSMETGRWHRQPIEASEKTELAPIVGFEVAVLQVDNQVFAFSALQGAWDSIALPAESKALPSVGMSAATVRDGQRFYAFSPKSGRWAGIDLDTGMPIK